MKDLTVRIIYAFAEAPGGGNPAGLLLDADGLSPAQKLEIARKVGLSETAFVSHSEVADLKLEFFTPTKQIAHCGHATIATFAFLRQTGIITSDTSSKETIDGIKEIFFEGDLAFMEQTSPVFQPVSPSDRAKVLISLGLRDRDLLSGLEPMIVNAGNAFLIVPVKNERLLKKIKPDLTLIEQVSEKYSLIGFYCYSPSSENHVIATTRMFGPYYGITEEAATGMAAGPLAAYLDKYCGEMSDLLLISQGRFMHPPSPSLIQVRLVRNGNQIEKLFAGGKAFLAKEMKVSLNEN